MLAWLSSNIALIVVVVVVLILVIWFISGYNGFVKLKNDIEEAFGAIDVYLKKRYDLIPNVVETVKGYAKHESDTLEKVISARNMAANSKTMEESIANENMLQGTLKSLFSVTESYPDLKADAQFIALQGQLTSMETEIERARRFYNAIVANYNTRVQMFPNNLLAGIFHFAKEPLFEITDETQRENVKVSF